jgi:hypothetical protein
MLVATGAGSLQARGDRAVERRCQRPHRNADSAIGAA